MSNETKKNNFFWKLLDAIKKNALPSKEKSEN